MIEMRCMITFLVHVMPLTLILAPHDAPSALSKEALHSLHQDNQNEKQYDFFGHVTQMPFSLASHNTIGNSISVT